LNKAQLVARVARDAGLTKADTLRVLDGVLAQVTRSLKKGERATLVGFGTFLVGHRRSRAGRNPRTGEPIRIAGRRVPKFTAGKELKDLIR